MSIALSAVGGEDDDETNEDKVIRIMEARKMLPNCSGRELRAFSLDFFKKPAMYEKLAALRERFDRERPAAQNGASSGHTILGAFVTAHGHSSGRSVELLHLGCAVQVLT